MMLSVRPREYISIKRWRYPRNRRCNTRQNCRAYLGIATIAETFSSQMVNLLPRADNAFDAFDWSLTFFGLAHLGSGNSSGQRG